MVGPVPGGAVDLTESRAEKLVLPLSSGEDEPRAGAAGVGLYRLAARRLRKDKTAMAGGAFFLFVVACCAAAPLYARYVAHTGPATNHITETIRIGNHLKDVVSLSGIPIGPTWHSRFLLGADFNGRDVAVRLLYGGRNSLLVGFTATAVTMVAAVAVALVAGFYRGWSDTVLSRMLDVIWAYPAILLGVAIGTTLTLGGISLGPVALSSGSLLIPALIIGFVNIPYVAKPIRGQIIALREREFVQAAHTLGQSPLQDNAVGDIAQCELDDRNIHPVDDRQFDPARGRIILPRGRGATAQPFLGHDDQRRGAVDHQLPQSRPRARPGPCAHSVEHQSLR